MPYKLPLKRLFYIKTVFQVEDFLTLGYRASKQFMKFTTRFVFLPWKTKI